MCGGALDRVCEGKRNFAANFGSKEGSRMYQTAHVGPVWLYLAATCVQPVLNHRTDPEDYIVLLVKIVL